MNIRDTDESSVRVDERAAGGADDEARLLRAIRFWIGVLVAGLVVSGLTAFPLLLEMRVASSLLHAEWSIVPELAPEFVGWIDRVREALEDTYSTYPFMAYGTDWLAFAHLMIAAAFWGPLRDPVRNIWVIQWGMIACVGIIPLALVAGAARGLPAGWQLIDISFALGIVPLMVAYRLTRRLERLSSTKQTS